MDAQLIVLIVLTMMLIVKVIYLMFYKTGESDKHRHPSRHSREHHHNSRS